MAKTRLVSVVALLLTVATAQAADVLTPSDAINHVGERATVCGTVASTTYAASSRGQPTFINLDMPFPRHVFTVVIWRQNRAKFGQPEVKYRDKQICVTGVIETYRGKAQIEATSPSQITLKVRKAA